MTIDAGPLFAYYRQQKPQTDCTLNDCVVLAVGRAMAESPAVRSQTDGDEIVEYPHANIGIAGFLGQADEDLYSLGIEPPNVSATIKYDAAGNRIE